MMAIPAHMLRLKRVTTRKPDRYSLVKRSASGNIPTLS